MDGVAEMEPLWKAVVPAKWHTPRSAAQILSCYQDSYQIEVFLRQMLDVIFALLPRDPYEYMAFHLASHRPAAPPMLPTGTGAPQAEFLCSAALFVLLPGGNRRMAEHWRLCHCALSSRGELRITERRTRVLESEQGLLIADAAEGDRVQAIRLGGGGAGVSEMAACCAAGSGGRRFGFRVSVSNGTGSTSTLLAAASQEQREEWLLHLKNFCLSVQEPDEALGEESPDAARDPDSEPLSAFDAGATLSDPEQGSRSGVLVCYQENHQIEVFIEEMLGEVFLTMPPDPYDHMLRYVAAHRPAAPPPDAERVCGSGALWVWEEDLAGADEDVGAWRLRRCWLTGGGVFVISRGSSDVEALREGLFIAVSTDPRPQSVSLVAAGCDFAELPSMPPSRRQEFRLDVGNEGACSLQLAAGSEEQRDAWFQLFRYYGSRECGGPKAPAGSSVLLPWLLPGAQTCERFPYGTFAPVTEEDIVAAAPAGATWDGTALRPKPPARPVVIPVFEAVQEEDEADPATNSETLLDRGVQSTTVEVGGKSVQCSTTMHVGRWRRRVIPTGLSGLAAIDTHELEADPAGAAAETMPDSPHMVDQGAVSHALLPPVKLSEAAAFNDGSATCSTGRTFFSDVSACDFSEASSEANDLSSRPLSGCDTSRLDRLDRSRHAVAASFMSQVVTGAQGGHRANGQAAS
eukprot:TRINITY_DN82646_c0_g1_i1.p1 TRINITY_DN82646_c0_g1~~TRINITY_DN82646_c0_g1_i1.p1  ORF type:complete len:689 (-),score=139.27 TRINITY_DN82646_c0_g1_i1:107-2173(-)